MFTDGTCQKEKLMKIKLLKPFPQMLVSTQDFLQIKYLGEKLLRENITLLIKVSILKERNLSE